MEQTDCFGQRATISTQYSVLFIRCSGQMGTVIWGYRWSTAENYQLGRARSGKGEAPH